MALQALLRRSQRSVSVFRVMRMQFTKWFSHTFSQVVIGIFRRTFIGPPYFSRGELVMTIRISTANKKTDPAAIPRRFIFYLYLNKKKTT